MNKKRKTKSSIKAELPVNEIICGHNIREMRKFSDNSIDSIITDPPYGLEFMGKDWDKLGGGISSTKNRKDNFAKQRKNSLPFGGGGQEVCYGKSTESMQHWHYRWAKECLRIAKPGTFMLVFGGTRTFHRLACAVEDAGWQIRDCLMWLYGSGFPKALDISKAIDKAKGKKRKVIGTKKGVRGADGTGSENEMPGKATGIKQVNIDIPITTPSSKLAKLWDGYGTAFKPAWEPIIVAMKPVDGNFAKNAEKYGVAGLNIDGGRIGIETMSMQKRGKSVNTDFMSGGETAEHQGRWPANVILDEEAAKILDKQSGMGKSTDRVRKNNRGWGDGIKYGKGNAQDSYGFADSGGASRFFYIAKSSRSERNAGCGELENKQKIEYCLQYHEGKKRTEGKMSKNFHPTVKPLQLMQYLCMLLKMPNKDQIILDPFVGSGTTCVACRELGINYIGIDSNEDYCKIARKRLKNVKPSLFEKPKKKKTKKKESFGL